MNTRRRLYKRIYFHFMRAKAKGNINEAHKLRKQLDKVRTHKGSRQTKDDFLKSFKELRLHNKRLNDTGYYKAYTHHRTAKEYHHDYRKQQEREAHDPQLMKLRKFYKKLWYQRKRAKNNGDMTRYKRIDKEMNQFRIKKRYRKQRLHKSFQNYVHSILKKRALYSGKTNPNISLPKSISHKHVYDISNDDLIKATKLNDYKVNNGIYKNKSPENTSVFKRNRYVAELSKRFAHGRCQLCGTKMFINRKTGEPYLESHHIQWLSHGGKDVISNVIALCPNCHRMMHFGTVSNDVIEELKAKAATLANKYVY